MQEVEFIDLIIRYDNITAPTVIVGRGYEFHQMLLLILTCMIPASSKGSSEIVT